MNRFLTLIKNEKRLKFQLYVKFITFMMYKSNICFCKYKMKFKDNVQTRFYSENKR